MMFPMGVLGVGHSLGKHAHFGEPEWWIAGGISVFLVLFAGVMSGLTLGLMSLGLVDLEVLQQSGSEEEKRQASMYLNLKMLNLLTYLQSPVFSILG